MSNNLNFDYLRFRVEEGWIAKGIPTTEEYLKRKEYELGVVESMNFCDYFLIVEDIISWAKQRGIPVGPGRGSGAGCILCYALDITTLDPIYFGLLFERFLNPERISMPDLDMDFCKEQRKRVIEYVRDRYGADRVAHIITFGSMGPKASIRDVSRAQQIDNYVQVGDTISKAIPASCRTLEDAVEGSEFLQKQQALYPELFQMAGFLSGKVRQPGKHPAGVLITPKDVVEYMPLFFKAGTKKEDVYITQWDMYDIEDTGFLKMDFLGLNTLTVIDKAVQRINRDLAFDGKPKIDIEKINLNDPLTLKLFADGHTTGIFQLERKYVQDFCRTMGMEDFMDVVVMNAIIRPGTMDAGTTQTFIARRRGDEPVEYMHESLEGALKETYGIMVYQEQAMRAAQDFAGFTLAEADNLRKAIGKKIASKMAEIKEPFIERAMERKGRTREDAEMVFGYIEKGQRYSFNKSHAASYGKITFQAAYLKAHYKIEFLCELLNGEYGGSQVSKVGMYVEEARFFGIDVIRPSIMTSEAFFEIRDGEKIEFGLAFIKNVSPYAAREVVKARGKYTNMAEFLIETDFNTLNSQAVDSMIRAGALDCFGSDREVLIAKHHYLRPIVDKMKKQQKRKAEGTKLRKELTREEVTQCDLDEIESEEHQTFEEMLDDEKTMTDAYLTASPMTPFEKIIRSETTTDIADVVDGLGFNRKSEDLCLAGIVNDFREHIVKKGKTQGQEMAFLSISKDQRDMDAIIFPSKYPTLKEQIEIGKVYLLYGSIGRGSSFIVNDLQLLSTI